MEGVKALDHWLLAAMTGWLCLVQQEDPQLLQANFPIHDNCIGGVGDI